MSTRGVRARLQETASGRPATVVAVRGGLLHLATATGLEQVPATPGVQVGDRVTVREGRVLRASAGEGERYFL